jgi:hypothetical protein
VAGIEPFAQSVIGTIDGLTSEVCTILRYVRLPHAAGARYDAFPGAALRDAANTGHG